MLRQRTSLISGPRWAFSRCKFDLLNWDESRSPDSGSGQGHDSRLTDSELGVRLSGGRSHAERPSAPLRAIPHPHPLPHPTPSPSPATVTLTVACVCARVLVLESGIRNARTASGGSSSRSGSVGSLQLQAPWTLRAPSNSVRIHRARRVARAPKSQDYLYSSGATVPSPHDHNARADDADEVVAVVQLQGTLRPSYLQRASLPPRAHAPAVGRSC